MKKIILLSILFSIMSCVPIYKMLTGVRNPKIEEISTLEKYLDKMGVPSTDCFVFSDSNYVNTIKISSSYFATYEVYNDKWQKIIPKNTLVNQCYGRINDIVQEINNKHLWEQDSTDLNPSHLISEGLFSLDKKQMTSLNINKDNYLIVFYWAKFMGNHSQNLLNIGKDLMSEKKDNVNVVFINMDLRENIDKKYLDSLNIKLNFN